jgi:membrane associated rhomboid family serine protease
MIPLRTAIPTRYPPIITWLLIASNCLVFLYQQSLSPAELNEFINQFALVPARYTGAFADGSETFNAADFIPFITMMFMHGGWLHLIFNMWTLWLFGPTIEDRLGHGRYLVFYFCCGIAASLAQVIFNPTSTIPALGASGAIAGVLGCYMGLFPFARVIVLVPILFLPLFFELPAMVFIGLWFLIQMAQGFADLITASDSGGIASWAHIGGFLMGLVLIPFIQRPERGYRPYYADEGILGFNTQGLR